MKTGYRYISGVNLLEGGGIKCRLNRPIKCSSSFFIEAFWIPMKHQIGKKFTLLIKKKDSFDLWYNQLATPKNVQELPDDEFIAYVKHDAKETAQKAMRHIDRIMAYMYSDEEYLGKTIQPFIDDISPIKSITNEIITMNGRLPMQEEYFLKKYWRPLIIKYKSLYKGVQFELHFSDNGTTISPTIYLRERDAQAEKYGVYNTIDANPILQRVTSDIADLILQAASEYTDACN